MPLMEVTLETIYAGQVCINRWNYVATGTPASLTHSFALTNALGAIESAGVYPADRLMAKIAAIMSAGVVFDLITVKDVYSVTDFYSTPFISPLGGARAGEGMSPINAIGFRTNRVRSDIRRATKRFVGVSENDAGSQGVLTGAILALLTALAAEMSEVQTWNDEGSTLTYAPCVVGKQRYNPETGLADPNGTAYRYYKNDEEEQMLHIAEGVTWDAYAHVRSQVSRQYGKGR